VDAGGDRDGVDGEGLVEDWVMGKGVTIVEVSVWAYFGEVFKTCLIE
jgi:hypothetical protein